jgi:hypothetical protein
MRSDGRFDPVLQGNLDEMKDHYETSADEDYAAEKYELGFEDGTDMKDDGSETSEKGLLGPASCENKLMNLRKNRKRGQSKERTEATAEVTTKLYDSVRLLFQDEAGE